MIAAVRHYGIIPFFKCGVPGWSIEEMTPPEHWFFSSDELGPWDWKIEVVREGDIAYGKFLGGKASFATVEYYAHLMNWRRSLPKYRVALGDTEQKKGRKGSGAKASRSEILMTALSPAALKLIRQNGSADSKEIRKVVSEAVTPSLLRSLGTQYKANLVPVVKKSISDNVMQFLEMGTWSVIGDFTRVYRGPNAEYTGWQRGSHTTPDELFKKDQSVMDTGPSWARFIEPESTKDSKTSNPLETGCTPEESLEFLINHISSFHPGYDNLLRKKIF